MKEIIIFKRFPFQSRFICYVPKKKRYKRINCIMFIKQFKRININFDTAFYI